MTSLSSPYFSRSSRYTEVVTSTVQSLVSTSSIKQSSRKRFLNRKSPDEVSIATKTSLGESKSKVFRNDVSQDVVVDPYKNYRNRDKYFKSHTLEASDFVPTNIQVRIKSEPIEDVDIEALPGGVGRTKSELTSENIQIKQEDTGHLQLSWEPQNWRFLLNNIKLMRSKRDAVVDSQGCERTADLNEPDYVSIHYYSRYKDTKRYQIYSLQKTVYINKFTNNTWWHREKYIN